MSIGSLPQGVDNQVVEYVGSGTSREDFRNLRSLSQVDRKFNQLANGALLGKIRKFFLNMGDDGIRKELNESNSNHLISRVYIVLSWDELIRKAKGFRENDIGFFTVFNHSQCQFLDYTTGRYTEKKLIMINDEGAGPESSLISDRYSACIPIWFFGKYCDRSLSRADKIELLKEISMDSFTQVMFSIVAASALAYAYFG